MLLLLALFGERVRNTVTSSLYSHLGKYLPKVSKLDGVKSLLGSVRSG